MTDEVAGSPKPDRSDISLPKVLVHQATESDKGEESTGNDVPNAAEENGTESNYAQDVGPSSSEIKNAIDSSLNKNVDNVEATEPVGNSILLEGELAEFKADIAKVEDDAEYKITPIQNDNSDSDHGNTVITGKTAVDSPSPLGGENENHTKEENSYETDAVQRNIMVDVTADNIKRKEEQVIGETAERLQVKTPERLLDEEPASNVPADPSSDASENTHREPPEESHLDLTTLDHFSSSLNEDPCSEIVTTVDATQTSEKVGENRDNSPEIKEPLSDDVQTEQKHQILVVASVPFDELPCDQEKSHMESLSPPVITEDSQQPENLLEMVANGKTELIDTTDTAIPNNESNESVAAIVQEGEEGESNDADMGKDTEEESQSGEATADSKLDAAEEVSPTTRQDEEASVSSGERMNGESHYDASVSGNEDDVSEQITNRKADSSVPQQLPATYVKSPVEDSKGENLNRVKTPDEMMTRLEDRADNVPKMSITPELESLSTPALPNARSPARSPKIVKFSSDTKPVEDSDSDSDVVINNLVEKRYSPQDQVAEIDQNSRRSIDTPEPHIIKGKDLEDREGMEYPIETRDEDEIRGEGANSKLSDETEKTESRTVAENEAEKDSPDIASAARKELEQYKRKKEAEIMELQRTINELNNQVKQSNEEKNAERQRVADKNIQIKRMTDDSSDNAKTIATYEEKIRTLEERVKNYETTLARHEQTNGTAPAHGKENQAKKSSVCVIL